MNTDLLNAVKKAVAARGESILSEPKVVSAFLSDLASDVPKPQKKALITCLEHNFAQILQNADKAERANCKQDLIKRFYDEEKLDIGLCRNTIELLATVLYGEENPPLPKPAPPPPKPSNPPKPAKPKPSPKAPPPPPKPAPPPPPPPPPQAAQFSDMERQRMLEDALGMNKKQSTWKRNVFIFLILLGIGFFVKYNDKDATEKIKKSSEEASSPSENVCSTYSPSFDCCKATTASEKAICSDSDLAELDKKLAETYSEIISNANSDTKENIQQAQKGWLKERNNCSSDIQCLKKSYNSRILVLEKTNTEFTDTRDGKKYPIVQIGKRVWMAENLNYNARGSKCYDNDESNCQKYGRLYNWSTAMKACPAGWHLLSMEEWFELMEFAGEAKIAGKKLKAQSGWNEGGNGTDDFGFAALPGGVGNSNNNSFNNIGYYGYWWNSDENDSDSARFRYMRYDDDGAIGDIANKSNLLSVRCLRN